MAFPFSAHIALLEQCLDKRQAIAGSLESRLFGARGKSHAQQGDRESIAEAINGCFAEVGAPSGQLEAAHLADGFEPARHDGYSRALDPVELVLRACHYWDTTRWPGTNGRLAYAQRLYAVVILRQLEHLCLRIWDDDGPWSLVPGPGSLVVPGPGSLVAGHGSKATKRLQQVQHLLDRLNAGSHGVRLLRDARWLIQTAQGPLTRHVTPYFIKAGQISESFADAERLEIHKSGAVLAGGHLRSQLRHLSRRTGWAFDDPRLVALTRSSNSMDMALLVRDLVPLLEAYGAACARRDSDVRLTLADAILQGLSADPELLLTRLDLLGPSTAIEELFVHCDENGATSYTALGESHRDYLARFGELVGRTAESLREDNRELEPARAAYSPLGIVYGFCADLLANMVLNTLSSRTLSDLSLEDMFASRGRLDDKRIQAHEWTRLPKGEGERDAFEHSIEWASQMYARLTAALEARAARPAEPNASNVRTSRLFVVRRGVAIDSSRDGVLPPGIVVAQEHCLTSDMMRARSTGATALPADRLIADRAEGRLLACGQSDAAWFGVSKILLTLLTSQGKDAVIVDVPPGVVDVLAAVCPEILAVVPPE